VYNKAKLLPLQPSLTYNLLLESKIHVEAYKKMKQSLQRGDLESFEGKWRKMYGIRKVYWRHPYRSQYARWLGLPKEGYSPVIKKRVRKKSMYKQEDIEIQLLEPFDNGTVVDKEMTEELIFVNFIPSNRS
jgi:hypothetical protein